MQDTRYREVAPLLLRLFLAFVLVYGTQDNVFSRARMLAMLVGGLFFVLYGAPFYSLDALRSGPASSRSLPKD